jgi:hypothetical protein
MLRSDKIGRNHQKSYNLMMLHMLRIAFKLLRILFKGGALGSNVIAIPGENSQSRMGVMAPWRFLDGNLFVDSSSL